MVPLPAGGVRELHGGREGLAAAIDVRDRCTRLALPPVRPVFSFLHVVFLRLFVLLLFFLLLFLMLLFFLLFFLLLFFLFLFFLLLFFHHFFFLLIEVRVSDRSGCPLDSEDVVSQSGDIC